MSTVEYSSGLPSFEEEISINQAEFPRRYSMLHRPAFTVAFRATSLRGMRSGELIAREEYDQTRRQKQRVRTVPFLPLTNHGVSAAVRRIDTPDQWKPHGYAYNRSELYILPLEGNNHETPTQVSIYNPYDWAAALAYEIETEPEDLPRTEIDDRAFAILQAYYDELRAQSVNH